MPKTQMLINYTPGDECRVAIIRDGQLEEFFAERMNAASSVGNIAVGRVTNVESAIQAAFIDFGHEQNGFLHITDLHPRYFPGEGDETIERVGKKTPRRDRPLMQHALKKGQEVVVQVIKEGIGTKGPTLSSYLSIPGRFLVMMPDMDRVGVSRKVDDDDQRREMKKVLDQLDLPDGFGFILRTAGLGRTKMELKRDLAYLQRLWRDMEKRQSKGRAPKLLYAESDLLVRTLRDVLSSEIDEVIIDHPAALTRAANFMKIVSPRASAKLLSYDQDSPIFHAYGVEEQIKMMHSREVPLPSGGRLVIDETEALVAIDVNSGRSRSAGDAETNAVRTNLEAADEICRQLKLRDLGGLVILDMIDMRHRSNRAKVEAAVKENFKRDRARTKVLGISMLGLIELTRQRMRGSMLNTQYADCPTCAGFGKVQRPGFVASDGMRDLAALLHHSKVQKVEMVVSPRVATEYLTGKRRALGRLEHQMGKTIEIRVSETIPVDRVTYYAYDERGADIAIEQLPKPRAPKNLKPWSKSDGEGWATDPQEEAKHLAEAEEELFEEENELIGDLISQDSDFTDDQNAEPGKKRRRRRRGRGRRGAGEKPAEDAAAAPPSERSEPREETETTEATEREETGGRKRRRRRRRGRGDSAGAETTRPVAEEPSRDAEPKNTPAEDTKPARSRRSTGARPAKDAEHTEEPIASRPRGRTRKPEPAAPPAGSAPSKPAPKKTAPEPGATPAGGVVRKAWGFGVASKPAAKPAPKVVSKASAPASKKKVTKKSTTKKVTKKTAPAAKKVAKKTTKKTAASKTTKKPSKKTTKKAVRKTSKKNAGSKASRTPAS